MIGQQPIFAFGLKRPLAADPQVKFASHAGLQHDLLFLRRPYAGAKDPQRAGCVPFQALVRAKLGDGRWKRHRPKGVPRVRLDGSDQGSEVLLAGETIRKQRPGNVKAIGITCPRWQPWRVRTSEVAARFAGADAVRPPRGPRCRRWPVVVGSSCGDALNRLIGSGGGWRRRVRFRIAGQRMRLGRRRRHVGAFGRAAGVGDCYGIRGSFPVGCSPGSSASRKHCDRADTAQYRGGARP